MFIVSVVAHVDHGKTTLLDSLLSYTHVISRRSAGKLRYLDTRNDEQERGITLKLSFFQAQRFIFIDTPGHTDFHSLTECSARLCDHFIFIVDVNEGITPRTLALLALTKGKRCTLVLNKIDKLLGCPELVPVVLGIVQSMNACLGEHCFEWRRNNVVVCSGTGLYGVCYGVFGRIRADSTLKDALVFLYVMSDGDGRTGRRRQMMVERLESVGVVGKELKDVCPLEVALFNSLNDAVGRVAVDGVVEGGVGFDGQVAGEGGIDGVKNGQEVDEEGVDKGIDGVEEKNVEEGVDKGIDGVEEKNVEEGDMEDGKEDTNITNTNTNITITDPITNVKLKDKHYVLPADHRTFLSSIVPEEQLCSIIGITTYAVIHENVLLFITRLFTNIHQGMVLFTNTQDKSKQCTITKIYTFMNDRLIHTKSAAAPTLVALQSNFYRNSILSTRALNMHANLLNTQPFYTKMIRPWCDMKERIRMLSYCEPILRAKVNRYGEVELLCEGRMHFEKIAHDLRYEFDEVACCDLVCEGCGDEGRAEIDVGGLSVCLVVGPSDCKENYLHVECYDCDEVGGCNGVGEGRGDEGRGDEGRGCNDNDTNNNDNNDNNSLISTFDSKLCINATEETKNTEEIEDNNDNTNDNDTINNDTHDNNNNGNDNTININTNDVKEPVLTTRALKKEMMNVINVFIKKGPLLHEKVLYTSFYARITRTGASHPTPPDLFPKLLKTLTTAYNNTHPIPIAFYYRCKLSITEQYVGKCYKLLNKYRFKMLSNEYDGTNRFFVVEFRIRRCFYNDFSDELKSVTRGTFYVYAWEEGYVRYEGVWDDVVVGERRRKGMGDEEVIVSEPEKQRTLKK
ncbi:Translation elongation factor 2/ribosome biogenesis protein RIA1 [Trachipleistophora hominis]|uniref:Translation elongation factor 2/ribosome biogenesis protein RIA1 n=1 Tax=Trachipleistophora hominis TaxID=72359 RepID=L7JWJ2_TRAHO|nr:Translation elongation factor 2/ribosome biogenesis protein RIA1 [Trachipleistophora hominis]